MLRNVMEKLTRNLMPEAMKYHGKAHAKVHVRDSDPWRSSYGGEFA